eukprot:m.932576 g.932576  ORF g.932576 m.932576 type:complete len:317 (+) comp23790_c1_seq9:398-1348(+)
MSNDTIDTRKTAASFSQWWPQACNPFIAGSVGGLAEVAFSHPIDTFKVRLQSRRHDGVVLDKYRFKPTFSEFRTLFRGLGPSSFRGFTSGAIFLGANDWFKTLYGADNRKPYSVQFLGAAAICGIFETAIYCPLELVKIQRQVGNHKTVAHCYKALYGNGGVKGLYMGGVPLVWAHIVGNIAFFVSYAQIQLLMEDVAAKPQGADTGRDAVGADVLSTTLAGGVAGSLYYFVGQPLDVVQSNMMAQRYPGERYLGSIHCTREIYRTCGMRGFMRGVVPNVIQAFPGGAASMLAFEGAMWLLESSSGSSEQGSEYTY